MVVLKRYFNKILFKILYGFNIRRILLFNLFLHKREIDERGRPLQFTYTKLISILQGISLKSWSVGHFNFLFKYEYILSPW